MARLPPAEMAFRESQWVSASPPWPPREAALWASPRESALQRGRTLRRGGTGSFQGSGGGFAAPTPLRFPPPSPANHPVEKRRRPCGGRGKGGEGANQESSFPGPFGLAFEIGRASGRGRGWMFGCLLLGLPHTPSGGERAPPGGGEGERGRGDKPGVLISRSIRACV